MPLEEYNAKRDFAATPEPAGDAAGSPALGELRFVIHKHAARALHYDLRLEIGGVFASWAVPKGPSLDPADKHLAVHVEDHPIEYGSFEGTIPAGEYGGGTVMIWDRGTFSPLGDPAAMLAAGSLKFVLSGTKLAGAFALVRMKPRPGEKRDNWLLIKERDAEVRPRSEYDVLAAMPDSAASGRDMDGITAGAPGRAVAAATGAAETPPPTGAVAGPMPVDAPFQLATLVAEAPEGDGWLHEVKYDGYRLRVALDRGRARVRTRNGADWTDRFRGIAQAAEALPASSALLDGEAVVFGADGRPDFGALQQALADRDPAGVTFVAFDLLYLDGFDLRGETLLRRKELLEGLVPAGSGPLRYAEHFAGGGPAFHATSCELLLEGSVSKRADRPWVAGRSRDWLKVKCAARQEFVVAGWTDPAKGREGFGALVLAVRDDRGGLVYAGRVGTGFTRRTLAAIRARLDALAAQEAPIANAPHTPGTHWVRPELVAEVQFREWTRDGVVRQPSFKGLREDADPGAVVREDARGPETVAAATGRASRRGPLRVAGIAISNPDKVLEPAGITKEALARYYAAVAPAMLPHVAGRLLTLVRCPHGRTGAGGCFYQKHPEPRGWPDSLLVMPVRDRNATLDYFYVEDARGLVALAQLGALEVHAWNSRVRDPERPDRFVLDLDPGPGVGFPEVVEAARTVRDALAALGLAAFAKTTGGHGLHVVTPIAPDHTYDAVRAFTHALVDRLAEADPAAFTAKMAKTARPGRVFVDYLRNAHGATAVCAFSARARAGAPVSVPVSWEELERGIDPAAFDTVAVPKRLTALSADPWPGYEAGRVALDTALFLAVGAPAPLT